MTSFSKEQLSEKSEEHRVKPLTSTRATDALIGNEEQTVKRKKKQRKEV